MIGQYECARQAANQCMLLTTLVNHIIRVDNTISSLAVSYLCLNKELATEMKITNTFESRIYFQPEINRSSQKKNFMR